MRKLFLFVATVLLALTSCTEENVVNESIDMSRIQASFEKGMESRMAIGDGNMLTWSANDTFTMFNENGESSLWKMAGTPGAEVGVFEGLPLDGTLKGAAYPSSGSPSLSGDVLTMGLPSELVYEAGICNLPMWASFSSLEENVSFKHLGALLKINFSGIPKGYTSLIVTADKAISGQFQADLSESEPVLEEKENGINSVKVSFTSGSGNDNNRMFYIPLPVGKYGSINVSISDGSNTVSIADWSDRIIVRKKVYLASLSYRVSDAETSLEVTAELEDMANVTANATIDLTQKVNATEGDITIPAEMSKVGLNFEQIPVTTLEAPLTIVEEGTASEATELVVSIPHTAEGTYVKFNTPTTTVNVKSGNYKKIVASTAANTLFLGENAEVNELVIVAGNVVLDGGKITGSINRDESNEDEVTKIYLEDKNELEGVTIGEGIKIVDNRKADYVTFTADAEQTFRLSQAVETLEYSVDGDYWNELEEKTVTFGGDWGDLRIRAKNGYGTALSKDSSSRVKFGDASVAVACSGDIRTLVDYENYENEDFDTSNARFCNLFFDCKNLTSAPKLPAITLASEAYWQMFVYCSSLKNAPELPATTLAENCYRLMFYDCKSMVTAPEILPATKLLPNIYQGLFYGCSNLKNAPELPATTLTEYCYSGMFEGCRSLENAPELPATTLAPSCYNYMFWGCSTLENAPELPATTLAASCYNSMFEGCSSLKNAPELPATTLTESCYNHMFKGCSALTSPPKLPATTLAYSCYSNMFAECTSLKEAPELPATVMAQGCYTQMFMNCTSLTVAPDLPATTLAPSCFHGMFLDCSNLTDIPDLPVMDLEENCYYGMFWNCTSLKAAPALPATTMKRQCYTAMFNGCTSLEKAPELPSTELAPACYMGMFSDCTSLKEAPKLPATKLANSCYSSMFARCSSLTKAPELPATELAAYCYSNMFEYCVNLTSAPELPATELALRCYMWMFYGCTSLLESPVLPATTLVEGCYMFMLGYNPNLNKVTMLATDVSAKEAMSGWISNNVSKTGVFYKNANLTDVSSLNIPSGWEVKDYEE